MVVYDITNRKSFKAVSDWITMIGKHANDNTTSILIGNKQDLDEHKGHRKVMYEEGQKLA